MQKDKKYELPKEFAEKWVAALRSGEYKQIVEILAKSVNGECHYCCLGVAAKINGFENEELFENGELMELSKEDEFIPTYSDITERGIPKAIITGNFKSILIELNDTAKLSFPEIADWIEQNVNFI